MRESNLNNRLDLLSDEEVEQITLLVEALDRSSLDFLKVELGDLKVTIGKGAMLPAMADSASGAAAVVPTAGPTEAVAAPVASIAPSETQAVAATPRAEAPETDGTVAIVSPMVGRYYAQAEPGAAPFVSVGVEVDSDTTVALIEVMKVFTAVLAGVRGTIAEICVTNDQYVEYGQVLFRVRPIAGNSNAESGRAKSSRKGRRA